tara:strand:+ start:1417 stop:2292 length:876 start_codon:yes stop_codon:yes gene_type:complete
MRVRLASIVQIYVRIGPLGRQAEPNLIGRKHCEPTKDASMRTAFFSKPSIHAMARVSGFAYLAYSILGIFITMGPSDQIWGEVTAASLSAYSTTDVLLYRTGLLAETGMYLFVMISAAAMYSYLRHVGPGLAAIGGYCRLAESIIGAAFIIFAYAALAILTRPELIAGLPDETRYALIKFFLHLKGYSIFFLLIIMSAGALSYYVLFFKSRFIPRWLSAWGIFTYATVGLGAVTIILFPAMTRWIMFVFLPGSAFEFAVGFWLLFRGIDMPAWDQIQSETPKKASGEKLTT